MRVLISSCPRPALITGDIRGRKQPVHLEIEDGMVTATQRAQEQGGRRAIYVSSFPISGISVISSSRWRQSIIGSSVTTSNVPRWENHYQPQHNRWSDTRLCSSQQLWQRFLCVCSRQAMGTGVPQAGPKTHNPIETSLLSGGPCITHIHGLNSTKGNIYFKNCWKSFFAWILAKSLWDRLTRMAVRKRTAKRFPCILNVKACGHIIPHPTVPWKREETALPYSFPYTCELIHNFNNLFPTIRKSA